MQNSSSDEEKRETRDLNVSAKPPQSTRDSCTIATSDNSTIKKSIPGTETDMVFEDWYEISFNKKGKDVSVKTLNVLQDSLPDPIHFIEKDFQSNSTQRKGEDKKDTAFQLIQKIHNKLQQLQWDLQSLHSMHKYEF